MSWKSYFFFVIAFICKDVCTQVTLTPLQADVVENGNITLTCLYNGTRSNVITTWDNSEEVLSANTVYENGCIVTGFLINKPKLYEANCFENGTSSVTLKNVRRERNGETWQCSQLFINSKKSRISVKVPISSVTMKRPLKNIVSVPENQETEFVCETSGERPAANITWYKSSDENSEEEIKTTIITEESNVTGGLSKSVGTLKYLPSRTDNGMKIYCGAINFKGSPRVDSLHKPQLDVQYSPDGGPKIWSYSEGDTYRVIEQTQGSLSCIIIGGNPPAVLTWSCYNQSGTNSYPDSKTVNNTVTWTATRGKDARCTCRSSQIISKEQSTFVNVKILYQPTQPSFTINSQTFTGTVIRIIQGNSLAVKCLSSSEPAPGKYTWKHPNGFSEETQVLRVSHIQTSHDGQYTCQVENTMKPSSGGIVDGSSQSDVQVQVLYAPSVKPFNVEPIVEKSPLAVECKTISGNPANTTFSWKRILSSSSDNTWQSIQGVSINGSHLQKTNITRNDAGTYNCTASNLMNPTAEQKQIGSHSQIFFLSVLYKASVASFIEVNHSAEQEVTVSENSSITLQCKVDSNPGSTINILKDGKTKMSDKDTQNISYTYSKVACDTAGAYRCVGYNIYNTEERKPLKDLQLFVTCSPRLRSPEAFVSNITSALNDKAQQKITVVAYPVPEYVWSKWNGDEWETLIHDNNVKVNTSGLESSLIFQNVKESDYQKYSVNVTNSFGRLHQEFFLNPYGKPNPPENVNVMDGSLRETSAKITWTPGFNGGPKQTFVVQYKKQGESTWLEVTKEDEGTESMNVSLSGLAHGTSYVFRVYSKNLEGNSSFTDLLTFRTLEKTESTSTAALIGGATGGSLVFIIVLIGVVVLFVRRSSFKKGKSKASSEGNDRKPVYEEENDYGMQDNPMYVSAGPRQSTSKAEESSSGGAAVYSTVNKRTKAIDNDSDNEYAVVNKTNKAKAKQGKKEKDKSKQGFFKDKKGKKLVQEGDIYENAPSKDVKAVPAKGETIYENPESSLSTSVKKKNVNKDGLIYADLTFNDQPKGQKKLVIHGLDSMTEYVQVDFTKKADPLPDSDDENIPPKN